MDKKYILGTFSRETKVKLHYVSVKCAISDAFVRDCGFAYCASVAQYVYEGCSKKFAAQPRRKTNFTTKRGVRDVTLLKRPLTQPLANRSSCFAQAVGCCKMLAIFVERSDARQGAVIPFVVLHKSVARVIHEYLLTTPGEYYPPLHNVKARIGLFKAG